MSNRIFLCTAFIMSKFVKKKSDEKTEIEPGTILTQAASVSLMMSALTGEGTGGGATLLSLFFRHNEERRGDRRERK